jgi:hypothetical protein
MSQKTTNKYINKWFMGEGHMVAWLVEALPYKLEGCGFDS